MGFESAMQEPSQEQLAQDYLAAHAEYQKLMNIYLDNVKTLDRKKDEDVAYPETIDDQQKIVDESSKLVDEAMRKYATIGERLTPETKDKYLK